MKIEEIGQSETIFLFVSNSQICGVVSSSARQTVDNLLIRSSLLLTSGRMGVNWISVFILNR